MIAWVLGRFRPVEGQSMVAALGFGIVMLSIRLWVAMPFWASGLTKWVDFPTGFLTKLSSSVKYLFASEFKLHLPGGPYPMPYPELMAWLSGVGEIVLPILLVLGVLSRPAALGVLAMTAIIQVTIPDGWPIHIQWALAGLLILAFGPGMFSADFVARKFGLERPVTAA